MSEEHPSLLNGTSHSNMNPNLKLASPSSAADDGVTVAAAARSVERRRPGRGGVSEGGGGSLAQKHGITANESRFVCHLVVVLCHKFSRPGPKRCKMENQIRRSRRVWSFGRRGWQR